MLKEVHRFPFSSSSIAPIRRPSHPWHVTLTTPDRPGQRPNNPQPRQTGPGGRALTSVGYRSGWHASDCDFIWKVRMCYIFSRGHVIKAAANTSLQQAYLLSDVTIVTYRLTAVLNFGVFKGLKRIQIPRNFFWGFRADKNSTTQRAAAEHKIESKF